ncbi:DUF3010 family protein [Catenovulum sp. 2E275]|uniref:DUF3010 family protein n=1 Tax=Catenovulum sp. 2E275 TaxID=2980497 RepID=UPI0021D30572|nr:DUF3010 family protein [Catenovulum sp. 2E275]MCU4675011.1 DUF3010 family protein [Catenovulum sp. 2E275]
MKACGVELKGSEAIICLLSLDSGLFGVPDCRAQKFVLKGNSQQDIKDFQFAFQKLMQDYKIEHVVIKERPTRGKFSGSAAGFKMEAAIQLIDTLEVSLQLGTAEKACIKRNPIPVEFKDTGLKMFQQSAFETAYAYLTNMHFGVEDEEEINPIYKD